MSFIETTVAAVTSQEGDVTIEELVKVQVPLTGGKYANKVYPLTKSVYEALKQSIKERQGLHVPITINRQGDVLDGHHRLRACHELGIEPTFEVKHFDNELEEELYVYEINRVRRQLTEFQKVELVLREKPLIAELAKRNMKAGVTLSRNQERVHTDKEVAKKAGHSKDFCYKVEQVIKAAEEAPDTRLGVDYDGRYRGKSGPTYAELLKDARAGTVKPEKAYNIIKHERNIIKKREEAEKAAKELGLPDKVILLNADSMNNEAIPEIKDNSVDLIVTDPPYLKDHALELYDGLARFAAKKLKEGGSLVFFYGKYQEPEIHQIFAKYKDQLSWWWSFCVNHEVANTTRMHAKGVRVSWKPMLWYVKGTKRLTSNDVFDFIQSKKPDKTNHPWAQSHIEAEYLIKNLTVSEDSLVVDPFLGSGAFAIPAIKLGRYLIGVEKDKEIFENARNYLIKETATTARGT
jgi:ParB-like chromosome segregation protein Spo0J